MHLYKKIAAATFIPAMLFYACTAQAVDVDPGDYTALPVGTNLALLYAIQTHRGQLDAPGATIDDAHLDSTVALARYVHYTKVGPFVVDPQVIVPFGALYNGEVAGSELSHSSGIGDITPFVTVWLVNKSDPEHGTYLGVSPILTVPTGAYDHNKSANLGSNRFSYDAQIGFIQSFSHYFTLDLIGDLVWYGDNDKYGAAEQKLSQDMSSELQAWGRFNLPDNKTSASLGYAGYWGGKQKVEGVFNGTKIAHQQVRLALQSFIRPDVQLEAIAGRDLEVQDGFREDYNIQLRIAKVW